MISVYAPAFRSPQDEKDRFFEELQKKIDGVLLSEILIVMGDLNARVGSSNGNTGWDGVIGSNNNLSMMNTFFEKRDIYKRTW